MIKLIKTSLPYIISILLMVVIIYWILDEDEYHKIIYNINVLDILTSICLIFIIFVSNGCILYTILNRNFNTRLHFTDIVLLPLMQRLFGYLIPFRGGVAFLMIYLKIKYTISLTKGMSVSIYIFLILLQTTGFIVLFYVFIYKSISYILFFSTLSFLLSPIIFRCGTALLIRLSKNRSNKYLMSLNIFMSDILKNQLCLYRDLKLTIVIISINLINLFIFILWYYWAIIFIMGTDLSLLSIIFISLAMKLSIFFRVIPGNIGIQELFSGSIFYLFNGNINDGFFVAIFFRFSTILLIATAGFYGLFLNRKYFDFQEVLRVWKELKLKQDINVS